MPVISSPTRSRYSSNIMSRSASRIRCRITCLAVWAAMRPKSSGVTSRSSIWSRYSSNFAGSISGSCGLDDLAGLGVDVGLLVDRLDDQLGLEVLGTISSKTRKSPVSGSSSTRAYFAAPGCFL